MLLRAQTGGPLGSSKRSQARARTLRQNSLRRNTHDDSPRAGRPYARRFTVWEREWGTWGTRCRRPRLSASASPGARRGRRCFGWCRITRSGCRRCTRSASRANHAAAIDRILTHLRTRAASVDRRSARSPPSTGSLAASWRRVPRRAILPRPRLNFLSSRGSAPDSA